MKIEAQDEDAVCKYAFERLRAGKPVEAFELYVDVPDGVAHAAQIAKMHPQKDFLAITQELLKKNDAHPQANLLAAEFALEKGDKKRALEFYRKVNCAFYPVGLKQVMREEMLAKPLLPFSIGPGSERDNWLIQRFIQLEAWEDAQKEYERIFKFHEARAQSKRPMHPPVQRDHEGPVQSSSNTTLTQYDCLTLLFILDYADFLLARDKEAKGLELLTDALLQIDLDRSPENSFIYLSGIGPASNDRGIVRRDFIHAVYERFKKTGKEEKLIATLEKNIKDLQQEEHETQKLKTRAECGSSPEKYLAIGRIRRQRNTLRRTWAEVERYRKNSAKALQLELEYLDQEESFSALTKIFRRGEVYAEFGKLSEAAAEYEKALLLPFSPPQMPEESEEQRCIQMIQQVKLAQFGNLLQDGKNFKLQLVDRLIVLYEQLNKTDRLLELSLKRFEFEPQRLNDFRALKVSAAHFAKAGEKNRFAKWAGERITEEKESTWGKAYLYWVINKRKEGLSVLLELIRREENNTRIEYLKDEFELTEPEYQLLLKTKVEEAPEDAISGWNLLQTQPAAKIETQIEVLEKLLNAEERVLFPYGKGAPKNPTTFKSYEEIAYRLARGYEKKKDFEKLTRLAIRIAKGEKPFPPHSQGPVSDQDENGPDEYANAILALAVHYAHDDKTQSGFSDLTRALENSPWKGALAQIKRKRAQSYGPALQARKAFGWSNLPPGVTLLASNENVLSLCKDDRHIYAGHPWGVAIYDLEGKRVARIALENAALHLALNPGGLWVGTPLGVSRIDLTTYAISHLPCDRDLPKEERAQDPFGSDPREFNNGVCALAVHQGKLWIGTRRNVQRYDLQTNEIRIFSAEELGVNQHANWNRFLFQENMVWADGDQGVRRYNNQTSQWEPPHFNENRHNEYNHIIDLIDGTVWIDVYVSDELRHRPAKVDSKTLKVEPLQLTTVFKESDQLVNEPFTYLGKRGKDLVFVTGSNHYLYNLQSDTLRILLEEEQKHAKVHDGTLSDIHFFRAWRRPDGAWVGKSNLMLAGRNAQQGDGENWTLLPLHKNKYLLAKSHFRLYEHDVDQLDQEWARQKTRESGGLVFLEQEKGNCLEKRVATFTYSDTLLADHIFSMVEDSAEDNYWLCSDYGLSHITAEGKVLENLTQDEGLLYNRVSSGVNTPQGLFFGCRTGDTAGGLMWLHPESDVFTYFLQEDGLACNSVEHVEQGGDKVKLTYAPQYQRDGTSYYKLYNATFFDAKTLTFSKPSLPRLLKREDIQKSWETDKFQEKMPFLGGFVLHKYQYHGRTYLCGTRGVAILEAGAKPKLEVEQIEPVVVQE